MNGLEYYKDGWDYRKSIGGWSVDVKIGKNWIFMSKFRTKKEAVAYIKEHINDEKFKITQQNILCNMVRLKFEQT